MVVVKLEERQSSDHLTGDQVVDIAEFEVS